MRAIPEIEQALRGERLHDRCRYREPADAGVENADRAFAGHVLLLIYWMPSLAFTKGRMSSPFW